MTVNNHYDIYLSNVKKLAKTICIKSEATANAFNQYLIERIREKTSTQIVVPENKLVEFKEALIFAFMGVLRMKNEINILSSATGSSADHCSGILL